tara:strand:- start:1693 stop:2769 length:1077 start_codon:yes stop_codon:yes gene_type:complete
VGEQFASFIAGNAQYCDKVVKQGTGKGQKLVICGAGPSLRENAAGYCNDADQLWGVNSALPWLIEHGYPVTHGITVDQTPEMVNEWESLPDVEYLIPSTSHPHLVAALIDAGKDMTWFNNFVGLQGRPVELCDCGHDESEHNKWARRPQRLGWIGSHIARIPWVRRRPAKCHHEGGCGCTAYTPTVMDFESWLYASLYPMTCRAGTGLNSVNRALDVAVYMGFDTITILGADCALRIKNKLTKGTEPGSEEHKRWLVEDTMMHADGGNALASGATPVTLGGEIDGKWWESKPDMMISAVFLEKSRQVLGDRLRLIGDTLPNALRDKPDEFLLRLPSLTNGDGTKMDVGQMAAGLKEWM